ncbi:MAG: kinase [Deltaproteobacteria bacterium]|jgi:serine/threonine protein kinase|nr:kinase [Deltaproteobacteria bacterium]
MKKNTVKVRSVTDNSEVVFDYSDPIQGGVKDVYFNPNREYAVAFFRDGLDASGRDRIEKLVGTYRRGIFENEGAEYWKKVFCWPEKIVEHDDKVGIVVPFYRENFFFPKGGTMDGSEKDGYWFASAKNFNRHVPADEKGSLMGFLQICSHLSRAVKRLHAAGLAHSDLSYRNCLIDPKNGQACIIDIDGLVVPGLFPPDVIGTRDFIAPEVVATAHLPKDDRNRVLPTINTDRHALAVLVYIYMFHRHPLRGSKVWDIDPEAQEVMEMGEKALFVEHPTDASNRVKITKSDKDYLPWHDTRKLPYAITGKYLKELFDNAFVRGLHSPESRPTANDWEDALVKTFDLLKPCLNPSCLKRYFVFDGSTVPVCPYCGTKHEGTIPKLTFYSSRDGRNFDTEKQIMTVYHGLYVHQWHVDRNVFLNERTTKKETEPVGYFIFHEGKWLFVNLKLPRLANARDNTPVPEGKAIVMTDGLRLRFSDAGTSLEARVNILNY